MSSYDKVVKGATKPKSGGIKPKYIDPIIATTFCNGWLAPRCLQSTRQSSTRAKCNRRAQVPRHPPHHDQERRGRQRAQPSLLRHRQHPPAQRLFRQLVGLLGLLRRSRSMHSISTSVYAHIAILSTTSSALPIDPALIPTEPATATACASFPSKRACCARSHLRKRWPACSCSALSSSMTSTTISSWPPSA